MSWIDAVDVVVLAVAIYAGLRVLRGTRAFQSLVGVGLLVLVYLLSSLAGLSTLHWVLDNLFVYAVLALLILFQEDIRRVLAQAGGTVFATGARPEFEGVAMIEEIVKATFLLAQKRVGALITIQRNASLEGAATEGHRLDALPSSELLLSLFHPSSPVHDGSVTVKQGRLDRVGVFLPLSESRELPKVYGTRHRAAIGVTEQTDAVCVVVSEERGTVGVAVNGRMIAVADPNELRRELQRLLGASSDASEEPESEEVSARPSGSRPPPFRGKGSRSIPPAQEASDD